MLEHRECFQSGGISQILDALKDCLAPLADVGQVRDQTFNLSIGVSLSLAQLNFDPHAQDFRLD